MAILGSSPCCGQHRVAGPAATLLRSVCLCAAVITVLSSTARAGALTYDIYYDSLTGVTTLSNEASSATDLMFWTRLGTLQYTPLFLSAGGEVTIDATGAITGAYTTDPDPHINKVLTGQDPIITCGVAGEKFTIYRSGKYRVGDSDTLRCNFKGDKFTLYPGWYVSADGDFTLDVDAVLSGSSGTALVYESSDWPGAADQVNVELLSGGLQSIDDSTSATSIFAPNGGTECISPEPGSNPLLACGLLCLVVLRCKLRARSVY